MSKDTVGQIINYLNSNADEKYTFEKYCTLNLGSFGIGYNPEYKIIKFADKLKDIVCLLLGCTREQLENREFKERELGEEWDCWSYEDMGNCMSVKSNQNTPDWPPLLSINKVENLLNGYKRKMTPRLMLQLLGTECGRQIIHPNIWVNSTFADYKPFSVPIKDLGEGNSFIFNDVYPNWIITDTRFTNEADAIKSKGGIVIRINRPCTECGGMGYHKIDCGIGRLEHASEKDLDKYNFDYVINNTGSIDDLVNIVKNIFKNDN